MALTAIVGDLAISTWRMLQDHGKPIWHINDFSIQLSNLNMRVTGIENSRTNWWNQSKADRQDLQKQINQILLRMSNPEKPHVEPEARND